MRAGRVVDPIGWDAKAQRVHDVSVLPGGVLLHHSICWCHRPSEVSGKDHQ